MSLTLGEGELLALVGESGCGKTTTGQALLRLIDADGGSIRFQGRDISSLGRRELRPLRRRMQIVYQDPYESLDPRLRVRSAVEEPLLIHNLGGSKAERAERVREALARTELSPPELSSSGFLTSFRAVSASASRSPGVSSSIRSSSSPTTRSRCSMSPCGPAFCGSSTVFGRVGSAP